MIKKLFSKIFRTKKVQTTELKNARSKKISPKISEVDTLLKQAAELKGKDITKAVEIMKRVISLTPNDNQKHYFKLANYLLLSGSIDGAYRVYDDLMAELKEEKIDGFNFNKSIIYERICMLNYKTGKYQDYMACYFYWLHNHLVGLAFQGKTKELTKVLKTKNKLSLMAPAKVEGCFKKLKKEDVKDTYNGKLFEYYSTYNEELIRVCKRVEELTPKKGKDKKVEPLLLNEDAELVELFKKYNNEAEMKFYTELSNLLEQ